MSADPANDPTGDSPPPEASETAPPAQPRRPRWSDRRLQALVALLAVCGVVGVPWYLHSLRFESTDDAYVDAHLVAISARIAGHVERVAVTDNQWVEAGDLLVELDPADLQAAVTQAESDLEGMHTQISAARTNVTVTQTTTEASMAEATANEQLAREKVGTAEARVASAQSEVEQAQAGTRQSEAELDRARAELAAAEAVAKREETDLARARALLESSGTQQQVDHAVASTAAAQAEVTAARERVRVAEAGVTAASTAVGVAEGGLQEERSKLAEARAEAAVAKAQLDGAQAAPYRVELSQGLVHTVEARIQGAQAALDEARLKLSYTRIVAPVSGWVTRKSVEPGEYVQPGQALLVVVPPEVWVEANFKETQLTDMRPGQPATITADAFPGLVLQGRVEGIQAGTGAKFSLLPPQNATGNYVKVVQRVPVKVVFDAPPKQVRLVPGLSVLVEVDVSAEGATAGQQPQAGRRAK